MLGGAMNKSRIIAGEVIDVLAGHLLRSRTCATQLESILLSRTKDADGGVLIDSSANASASLEASCHHVVLVNLVELAHAQPLLVEQVVRDPMLLLKYFDRALVVSQHYMHSKHPRSKEMVVKSKVKARVYGLPGRCLSKKQQQKTFCCFSVSRDRFLLLLFPCQRNLN